MEDEEPQVQSIHKPNSLHELKGVLGSTRPQYFLRAVHIF